MSAKTSIEWTRSDDGTPGRTWNPVRGCSRVSEGCRNCYAERITARMSKPGMWGHGFAQATKAGPRWTGRVELVPRALGLPLRWKRPTRIFVNSVSDLFHESLPDEAIKDVFDVMALADHHTFQILTKRPERMLKLLSLGEVTALGDHPLPNVWLGCSVENQETADARVPLLLQTPAAVRFISLEPQLARVDLESFLYDQEGETDLDGRTTHRGLPGLDWVIVGGESGPGARRFNVAWARSVVRKCKAAGVPVFVKQLGAAPYDSEEKWGTPVMRWYGHRDDPGRRLVNVLIDRKGGDMSEWPSDLRVREFPRG